MLPDEAEGQSQWNDCRDDDDDGRFQDIKAKDHEQKSSHQNHPKGDGVGDDGNAVHLVDADGNLIASQQASEQQQGAVEGGDFHGWTMDDKPWTMNGLSSTVYGQLWDDQNHREGHVHGRVFEQREVDAV